jgi:hypothetical protein
MIPTRKMIARSALLVLLAFGCSSKNPNAPASLHGKVTYKGSPVPAATITLISSAEGHGRYTMHADGNGFYGGSDLPAGECVVTVETPPPPATSGKKIQYGGPGRGFDPGAYQKIMEQRGVAPKHSEADSAPAPYVKIPPIYAKPETSPLRVNLSAGDQKKDLELTDG